MERTYYTERENPSTFKITGARSQQGTVDMDAADNLIPWVTKKPTAIIGSTGFVGSNLVSKTKFSYCFNSANIEDAHRQSFSLVVCCAAPGSMQDANRDPAADADRIESICDSLDKISADCFVLISTIATLEGFGQQADETTHRYEQHLAYGLNRHKLELFCQDRFENSIILRLPALYGLGLKKNFVFDILEPAPGFLKLELFQKLLSQAPVMIRDEIASHYNTDTKTGLAFLDRNSLNNSPARGSIEDFLIEANFDASRFTNPGSTFQYYGLDRLASDIKLALHNDIDLLHLSPEPLAADTIARRLAGRTLGSQTAKLHHEDMHTGHAGLWGESGHYIEASHNVLARLDSFAKNYRASKGR